jgi:hypothetical protein
MSKPIEDYGIIGNMISAALVSRDGSIDWLCLPRFDSGACFAALLGGPEHGRWLLTPEDPARRISRRYIPGTAVLETRFETATGACTPRGAQNELLASDEFVGISAGILTAIWPRDQHAPDGRRNVKQQEKPQKLSDGGGLHLLVNPAPATGVWPIAIGGGRRP